MNERGKLYLIIGRPTVSAAVNFTSAIEPQTQAILVGEDAGAGPNHYGDPKRYMLRVQISHSQFFAKDDPVMDMILADGRSLP